MITLLCLFVLTKKKNLDPNKYFVDSTYHSEKNSHYFNLYHIEGINKLKELQLENEKNKTKRGIKGNPGKSGTIEYDLKKKRVIGFYYWE